MKKLLLFLLILAGGVSTASAKTIYFVDNWGKSGLRYYAWTGDTNNEWPGVAFPEAESEKIDGCNVYAIDLGDYSNFMILYKNDSDDDTGNGNTEYVSSIGITVRKCDETSAESLNDYDYIDFSGWNSGRPTMTGALIKYTYNFNVTTSDTWSKFYAWIWTYGGSDNLTGVAWPGIEVAGTENNYTYTHYSFKPHLNIIFNQGLDAESNNKEKTCTMEAYPGNNYYNICGVNTDGFGEYVKTNASGYATFYNENHPITVPTGIAYVAEDLNNGSAKAYNITDVPYHTPMLIKATANTYYHFAKPTSDPAALTITNAFKAGTGDVVSPGDGPYNYILKGDQFYLANGTTNTVATNKAYLQLSQAATARVLLFDDEEEVTGITSVKSENSNVYFDLQGRRVAQPTKGLYIMNGKKFIKK